jgi:flavin reductase (DIM6/NTAB) family NADH-FMN oxidoreductase RutF
MGKEKVTPLKAMMLLNSGPTVLATTVDAQGVPDIITLAWLSPVSAQPPLVVIAISPKRHSYTNLKAHGEFVLNIPAAEHLHEAFVCGTTSGRDVDKFAITKFTPLPAQKVKPPLIAECVAHLECKVVDIFVTGDHELFVGEIVAASITPEWFDHGLIPHGSFLHHLGGTNYACTGEIVKA